MSIKTHITDPATGKKATVTETDRINSIVVATQPLKTFENKVSFFTNPTYGNAINQNAAAGGTPENVHNGIDDVYWTASTIVGTQYTFDSVARPHAGTKSILVNGAAVGNIMQIAKGGALTVSGYVSLTIWINVDSAWAAGDSISVYGWDTGTALQVGTAVNLQNYFPWSVFDTWHLISIPLIDMGLTVGTIDAIRISTLTKSGGPPVFYMDDIQFQETGAAIEYKIKPDKEKWLYVHKINIFMADNITGITTVAGATENATLPGIAYNKLLGVSALSTGIIFQYHKSGKIVFTATMKQIGDIMQFPGSQLVGSGGDGTNSWIALRLEMTEPFVLKVEEDDYLSITISENLSGLLQFTMSAASSEEDRS